MWGGQWWPPPRFYAARAGCKAGRSQYWLPHCELFVAEDLHGIDAGRSNRRYQRSHRSD